MELEKYISELLYDHDCVVVPGFGGIVGNYHGAEISELHNRFSPPYKQLTFNSMLTGNDGLLAHRMATSRNVPYPDAVAEIAAGVKSWKRRLDGGETLSLSRIGTFRKNESDRIEFMPDRSVNYLSDSFGLDEFHSPPVQREAAVEKILRTAKDTKSPKALAGKAAKLRSPAAPAADRRRAGTDWRIAAALPLLIGIGAFLAWTATEFGLMGGQDHFAAIEPVGMEQEAGGGEQKAARLPAKQGGSGGRQEAGLPDEAPAKAEDRIQEAGLPKEAPANSGDGIPDEVAETGLVATPETEYRFHIIGGCFSVPENAGKLLKELRSQGYDAVLAGTNSRGLHRVSYGAYRSGEEAAQALSQIRNSNKAAWLLKM